MRRYLRLLARVTPGNVLELPATVMTEGPACLRGAPQGTASLAAVRRALKLEDTGRVWLHGGDVIFLVAVPLQGRTIHTL